MVKFLASLKLAVCVIVAMTIMMIWGTLSETSHGPEYAKTAVYFSWPFLIVESLLFLNILFAALVRLPPKKRLGGFYVVHAGLLLILSGAALTALKGLDGSLDLVKGEPSRYVRVNEPQLHALLRKPNDQEAKRASIAMPRIAGEYNAPGSVFLKIGDYDVIIEKYLPFAMPKSSWADDAPGALPSVALWLTLANDRMEQPVALSNAKSESSLQQMGPLTLQLAPEVTSDCFRRAIAETKMKYLFAGSGKCIPLADLDGAEKLTVDGVNFERTKEKPFLKITVTDAKGVFNFYPQMTSFPINDAIQIVESSGRTLLDLDALRATPHVVFFGDKKFGAGKTLDWTFAETSVASENELPWMGFKMTVNREMYGKHEQTHWEYAAPVAGEEDARGRAAFVKIIPRDNPAAAVSSWIDGSEPASVTLPDGAILQMLIGPKMVKLPFDLALSQFKMDTNPGTNEAASYESFVDVKSDTGDSVSEHIFMNHPLKRGGFTFYQASYFQTEDGGFGTVLSVNRDPGRTLKYAGSLALVIGCIIHYILRSRGAAVAGNL